MPRTFRAREGRTITLPQGVKAGPGATIMRLDPGCTVTLDDAACVQHQRFINGRLRAGDLEEIDAAPAPAPAPTILAKPDPKKPLMPIEHGVGATRGTKE